MLVSQKLHVLQLAILSATAFSYSFELAPAAPLNGQVYSNASLSSWGGSVIQDTTDPQYEWHLFVAAFTESCGLNAWETNSEVVHGVAHSPQGPFAFHDVALPVWHHNPQIVRHVDGTYLLYVIGMDPQGRLANCSRSKQGNVASEGHGFELVQLWHSSSLYGPWTVLANNTNFGYPTNIFNGTNPSPFVLPNGTVVVASHGGGFATGPFGGGLQISVAPNWGGPYSSAVTVMQYDVANNYTFEDPFLWFDSSSQTWKVVLHQYNVSDTHHQVRVGGFGESATSDVFGPWTLQSNLHPVYNTSVTFSDGTSMVLARRERPKLLFSNSTGLPVALYTGVCPQGTDACFTLGQDILQVLP